MGGVDHLSRVRQWCRGLWRDESPSEIRDALIGANGWSGIVLDDKAADVVAVMKVLRHWNARLGLADARLEAQPG